MVMEDGVSFVLISRCREDWWAVGRKENKWQQKLNNQKWQKKKHLSYLSAVSQIYILNSCLHRHLATGELNPQIGGRTRTNGYIYDRQACRTLPIAVYQTYEWCFAQRTGRHMHVIQTDSEVVERRQWHPPCKHIWQVRKRTALSGPSVPGYPPQLAECRPKGISGSRSGDHLHQLAVKEDTWGPLKSRGEAQV